MPAKGAQIQHAAQTASALSEIIRVESQEGAAVEKARLKARDLIAAAQAEIPGFTAPSQEKAHAAAHEERARIRRESDAQVAVIAEEGATAAAHLEAVLDRNFETAIATVVAHVSTPVCGPQGLAAKGA